MARKRKETETTVLLEDAAAKKPLSADERAWSKRLSQSKAFQTKYSSDWDSNRALIFNTGETESSSGQLPAWMGSGKNTVAYGWGLYEGLETTIYVQNPDIIVTARDAVLMSVAKKVSQIVRYDIDQMDIKSIGNLCLLDVFICGYGAIIEDVKTYKGKKQNEDTGEEEDTVDDQEFEARRIDPKDILFDRNARRLDLSDSKYLFVAWYPTIDELRNDPDVTDLPDDIEKYPEASELTRQVAPTEGPAQRQAATLVRGGATGEKDSAFKTICVWEIFDKVNKKKLYMTDFGHRIIGEGKWPVDLKFGCRDMFPVTLLFQHPVPGRFYPMPECSLIASQLREVNVVEGMISHDTRTKWRKYLTIAGILSDDQKAQITDPTLANALVFVDVTKLTEILGAQPGQNIDPLQFDVRKLVCPMEDVSPAKDLFARYDMLEKEIQHIVGYGPAARGGLPSTRSAREAMMVNAEKERKLDKRKSRITDFYRLVAMKHTRYLQKYLSIERYAKIYPKVGDLEGWLKYTHTDIQGDFEFDVLAGSTVPKNTEARRASELELFKTVMPIVVQTGGDPRVPFARLAEFNDWDGIDMLFNGIEQKAETFAQDLVQFKQGKVPPQKFIEDATAFVMAYLGPAKLQMLAQKMQSGGGPQEAPALPEGSRGDPTPQKTTQGVL